MKGLLLDNNGDIVIEKNDIPLIEGTRLLAQNVRMVLGTNKGEWFGNPNEGINFKNILGKTPVTRMSGTSQSYEEDLTKLEILQGLLQVDDTFFMTSCEIAIDKDTRTTKINFSAETSGGEELSEVIAYA